jgi:hypothetical protein
MKKLFLFIYCLFPVFAFSQPLIQWQKTYGGTASDEASIVRATTDGGYIVTGLSSSADGDVIGHHDATDHWVIKLDAVGNIEWNNSFGGSGDDKGYDILQTADGGYVFTGYESSADGDVTLNHGLTDYWVVKLNSSGTMEWQKSYGGGSADNSYAIIQTLDGGYAVTGLSNTTDGSGDVTGNNGSFDYWLCKLSPTGTLQWQKSLGGTATEQAFGIVQNADSSYVICGYSSSPNTGMVTGNHGDNDYWIVKLDPAGNLLWERSYGGIGSDRGFGISKTSDGGYIVNGVSPSTDGDVTGNHGGNDYWVLKLDSDGMLQWQRSYGGSGDDFGRIAFECADGGFIIGGRTNSIDDGEVKGNHGDYDYWVLKVTSTGDITWKRCFGGSLGEGAPPSTVPFMNVIPLADNYYTLAGATFSTDGDAVGNISSGVFDDNYWIISFQDTLGIATGIAGNADKALDFSISPNPTHDIVNISFTQVQDHLNVTLYTIEGKLIAVANFSRTSEVKFPLTDYSPGIYLLSVKNDAGETLQKKVVHY